MRMRSMRPDRFVLNTPGGVAYRGAQVASLIAGTATITLQAEETIVRTGVTCAQSLIPSGAQSIGAALYCRVTGGAAPSYVIAEVFGSSYGPGAPSNPAASVARGEFHPGIIPRELTGEPLTWWEAGE